MCRTDDDQKKKLWKKKKLVAAVSKMRLQTRVPFRAIKIPSGMQENTSQHFGKRNHCKVRLANV